MSPFAAKVKRE